MQNKDDIFEELRLISELVAGLDRRTPYGIPEGYFDGLSEKVLGRVRQTPYSVPEGYFSGFADKLMARIKAGQEDSAGVELAGLSSLLSKLDKKVPFQVPEGYFGELTGNILSGVHAGDLVRQDPEDLSDLMTRLQHVNVYEVPNGYFDGVPEAVLAVIKDPVVPVISIGRQARVVSIGRSRKWLQIASAAIVAGLILTAGWLRFNRSGNLIGDNQDPTVGLLSKASDQEIESYLDNQHISLSEVLAGNNVTSTLDISDSDVKNILGDVSDDELQHYLEDNGSPKDLVTN
ncbi:MAG: hypothetical protein Q8938_00155 [Bacteroidota bacterium]|nr:hypothetical protein [Bacteroidota bacterium]